MLVIPRIVAVALMLLTACAAVSAQDAQVPADISALSVLKMAKDEAERATDETTRATLRAHVATRIRRTGSEGAFGSYVTDALSAVSQGFPGARDDDDEIDRFNSEIEQQARQALLAGDSERAEQLLRRCRLENWWKRPSCAPSHFPGSLDVFFQVKFFFWESDAGHYDAALHRLKTASWPPEFRQSLLIHNGPFIAGDAPERRLEVAHLLRRSGIEVESCLVNAPTYVWYTMSGQKPPTQIGDAAALRRLACTGQAQSAVASAQAENGLERRVTALGIVAEGLAQIPGLPLERLPP